MKQQREKIYLETSVPSMYYESEEIQLRNDTRQFWKELRRYEVHSSDLVISEISQIAFSNVPKYIQRMRWILNRLSKYTRLLTETEESIKLSNLYILAKALPSSEATDARHIAIASVNGMDYVVSWNYEHIARRHTQRIVNEVNEREGYRHIKIVTPEYFIRFYKEG